MRLIKLHEVKISILYVRSEVSNIINITKIEIVSLNDIYDKWTIAVNKCMYDMVTYYVAEIFLQWFQIFSILYVSQTYRWIDSLLHSNFSYFISNTLEINLIVLNCKEIWIYFIWSIEFIESYMTPNLTSWRKTNYHLFACLNIKIYNYL